MRYDRSRNHDYLALVRSLQPCRFRPCMLLTLSLVFIGLETRHVGMAADAAPAPNQKPSPPTVSPKSATPPASPSTTAKPKAPVRTEIPDDRWNLTEVGRFLGSVIPLPEQEPLAKGLSIRVGDNEQAAMLFDLERMEPRAGWSGAFLKFSASRFGLNAAPEIAGELLFTGRPSPIREVEKVQYAGMWQNGSRIILQYRVGAAEYLESPWLLQQGEQLVLTRSLERGASGEVSLVPVLAGMFKPEAQRIDGVDLVVISNGETCVALAATGIPAARWRLGEELDVSLEFPPSEQPSLCRLHYWNGKYQDLSAFASLIKSAPAPESVSALKVPGPARWTRPVQTVGTVGTGPGPYVIDTLTLPFENPYHALMFASGHDFFSDGDIALCTAHGDVWRISGVNDKLDKLNWKRCSTGLHQPLGLKIIDDVVHVLCRDQILRLHDLNGDQETDWYECFDDSFPASTHPHDYATCLETDSHGDFYFAHAVLGVVRVKKDRSGYEVIATGLRNPNGLSVGPDDTITAAPQEGTWTPASAVFEVQRGQHFGFRGPQVTPQRPLGYDPPLCWIPRMIDNSTGGQVWVTSDRWGPLKDQMFNLSYGKCQMMLVLREHVGETPQGGSVVFPLSFDSGIMRGRFSPHDGQMYLSGLRGWVTSAVLDGCLQRVRYTGEPVNLPVQVRTMQNGLAITFSQTIDAASVETGSFQIQQWNYRYSSSYGSAEYRVGGKLAEGRDDVPIESVTLLADGRTVFLEIPQIQPVMQMSIAASLFDSTGIPFQNTIYYTINKVGSEGLDPSLLVRKQSPGQLSPEMEEHLQPGLALEVTQGNRTAVSTLRMAALAVPADAPPAVGLQPGAFTAVARGYLKAPLRGKYRLRLARAGTAELILNGTQVLTGTGDLSTTAGADILLHGGYNKLELRYTSPAEGAAALQVLWQGQDFPEEPLSPALFWHDERTPGLPLAEQLREGRELFATRHCDRCHQFSFNRQSAALMPELLGTAPDLKQVVDRLNRDWLVEWILHPAHLRNETSMPQLLNAESPDDVQAAADIAAWLTDGQKTAATPEVKAAIVKAGEVVYSQQGCFACHRLTPPDEEDDFDRISLHQVGRKFQPNALRDFLLQPQAHHQWTRMPDFRLSSTEATQLASYLQANTAKEPESKANHPVGNGQRGAAAFIARGCVRCHESAGKSELKSPPHPMIPLKNLTAGCLAEPAAVSQGVPRYELSESQQAALRTYLQSVPETLVLEPPAEASHRLFKSLRCQACHPRDDRPSPRPAIFVEEFDTGFFPEAIPSLTWGGDKLYSNWIEEFLNGTIKYKPRLSLRARMPAFPAYAHAVATGLAAEHGHAPSAATHRFDPELAKIGNELSMKNTGLDCRQCHGIGNEQPVGDRNTLLAVGVNFGYIRDRVRPDFYQRFVLDPPRFDVNTKMPKLALDGRTTKITTYYHGDAARQFNALWNFIQTVPEPTAK